MMLKIFPILLLCSFQALAQDEWVNHPVDENCEVMFPVKPTNASTDKQEQRFADINGVRVSYMKVTYSANVPVASKDELQDLYRETFKGTLKAVEGTMEDFNYEYRDDVMLARIVYTMSKPGVNFCECKIMLARGKYYVFQACTMPDNKEAMEEVTEKFFRNVTINANLTFDDQKLPYDDVEESSVPYILGQVLAAAAMLLFLLWIILYVTLVVRRSPNDAGPLYKVFAVIRWAAIGLFFTLSMFMILIAAMSGIGNETDQATLFTVVGVIIGAIGTLVFMLKPPSAGKPAI